MKIINNLKGIRTQRKIAQKQLAMDTGYDPRTIRRVELGECCPSALDMPAHPPEKFRIADSAALAVLGSRCEGFVGPRASCPSGRHCG